MSLDKLPINWFDFVVVIVLLVGVARGRKNGMSEELTPLLQWVAIVVAGAYCYETLGLQIASATTSSQLFAYLVAYLALAIVVKILFTVLKRLLKGKLVGSDLFGGSEYYLGMAGGMVRFACMLIFALALLNARLFSYAEVMAMQKFQKDEYGSEFFPTLQSLQQQVFGKSLTGPRIKEYVGFLLIKPTAPEQKELKRREMDFP